VNGEKWLNGARAQRCKGIMYGESISTEICFHLVK